MDFTNYRYWFYLAQDVQRPVGGLKQIHEVSSILNQLGASSFVVHETSEFRPSWFNSSASIVDLDYAEKAIVNPELDVLVFPETYLSIAASKRWRNYRKILFNQNSHFSFGAKFQFDPCSVAKTYRSIFSHILCVSKYDYKFLTQVLGLDGSVSRIINSVDPSLFYMPSKKKKQISFMTRKNRKDANIVTSLLKSMDWFDGWKALPISDLPQSDVASVMRDSILYLSFGHPEGFGLPLVEASASGCALIGYSGNGGLEIFEGFHNPLTSSLVGLNDWTGFIHSTKDFLHRFTSNPSEYGRQLASVSHSVLRYYSPERMEESIFNAFNAFSSDH